MIRRAIDISNWSGLVSADTFRRIKDLGYELVICGTQRPAITVQQLQAAAEAGLAVEAYAWLSWQDGPWMAVQQALQTIEGLPVRRLWLDVEEPRGTISRSTIVDLINESIKTAGSFPLGIYTSYSCWHELTGNTPAFSELPLWNAWYDDDPDFDFETHPYGGWQAATMEQYTPDAIVAGVRVDVNVYREAA